MERFRILTWIFLVLFSARGFGQSWRSSDSRFQCNDGISISAAKNCNGFEDCTDGEDEQNCVGREECRPRNTSMMTTNNYTCKGECKAGRTCRAPNKICLCDDECGYSCVNQLSECRGEPPDVKYGALSHLLRMDRENKRMMPIQDPPYYFMDTAVYICGRGRKLEGPLPRCNAKKQWSKEIPRCVDSVCRGEVPYVRGMVSYSFKKSVGGRVISMPRGEEPKFNYEVDYDCGDGRTAEGNPPRCDENQRWTSHTIECVDVACNDAPDVPDATVHYSGTGIRRVARYRCNEGFYLESGKLFIRCSGLGVWNDDLPDCQPIQCGNPEDSVRATGGQITSYEGNQYNATAEFGCADNYRLLGSPIRRCMKNGQWSGTLTVCDRNDNDQRCPHPGVPINGRLVGDDFSIGAFVRFECDRGYVMHGSQTQTCLWFKQWNGTLAPTCTHPKYPSNTKDAADGLTRSFSVGSDKDTPRGILRNDTCRNQKIYFLFDVSDSVLRKHYYLKDEIEFAKRLVRRIDNFPGQVLYEIMIFASATSTIIGASEGQYHNAETEYVISTLDRTYNEVAARRFQSQTGSGTDTASALRELLKEMKLNEANESRKRNKQHVFIFTDGQHTEGEDPVVVKQEIESIFGNGIEFYSVTVCNHCSAESVEEMRRLSSGDGENFIVLEDFYQMSTYVDRVTDLRIDFGKCGQAGDIGSIKQQASLGRIVGGQDAAENAWPWQALISRRSTSMERSLSKRYLLGGGSILNKQWILTTAVNLNRRYHSEDTEWMESYVVFVGIFERPRSDEHVKNTVEAYAVGDYFQHGQFDPQTLVNDIALIKLGTKLDSKLDPIPGETNGVTFNYYIRPVCLPCTRTCLTDKHLVDDDGYPLLIDFKEKCRVEEAILLSHNAKAVVTGFGHLNQSFVHIGSRNFNPPRQLQQALLKVASPERCRYGIADINDQLVDLVLEYSESMICLESGIEGEVVDACKGDSGGPLVRELLDLESRESCWVQIGIVSFGYRCGSNFPGYYTNVARFIPWINDTMGGILSDGRPAEENAHQPIQRCIEDYSADDVSNGGGADFAECGRPGDVIGETSISRVVGGQDAVAGAWPWFALITRKSRTPELSLKKENLYGGGTIINQQWILTAAHALHRRQRSYFVIFVGLSERPLHLEAINASVEVYEIAEYVEHSHFDELAEYDNDIALIKLGPKLDRQMNTIPGSANGLTYGPNIRAICLASCGTENADTPQNCPVEDLLYKGNAVVIGFGHADSTTRQISKSTFAPPKHLQQATVRIEDRNRCQQDLNEVRGITRISRLHFTENMICCSSSRGYENACDGSSGGPLMKMISFPGNGTRWVQIGIVSFGYGCGIEYPGFYTDVSKYTSWIADVIA